MIRYKKLGYVELIVTDLARSRDFYENIVGLQFVGTGAHGELRFRCGDDPYSVVLHQGPAAGYKRTGWMLESVDQFDALKAKLRRHDVPSEVLSGGERQERGFLEAIRIVEPNTRAVIEFYVNEQPDAHYFFSPTVAKIMQLGHVVYATPKYEETVEFYKTVLNFAESDTIEGAFTFMRPWPNPYHHGVGVGRGDKTVYHHTNFMVSEIDDVGRAIHRFNAAGVPIVLGPGKHPASSSVFLYFLDPDSLTCEYSFGMEEFSEAFGRPPRQLPRRPEAMDAWGSPWDPRMGATGQIEAHRISG
jgi:2,3-dihydroxy-p-cumate/2,3-dihydroxybenzoate 3,4-dioxygenase